MSSYPALEPCELLLVGIVRQALRDARQAKDERLRDDALRFLWSTAPRLAVRADLPRVAVGQIAQKLPRN